MTDEHDLQISRFMLHRKKGEDPRYFTLQPTQGRTIYTQALSKTEGRYLKLELKKTRTEQETQEMEDLPMDKY